MNKIKSGYFSAEYFKKTTKIVVNNKDIVLLQFFQREDNAMLCGINEVITLLKKNTKFKKYKIRALGEGSIIKSKEPVLELEGEYRYFGFLEGVIDGILSRQTSIATNTMKIVQAANKTPIIAMNDRADHYLMQEEDGYAVYVGGIRQFVTDAAIKNVPKKDVKVVGTMPHVLIQMFNGDLIKAMEKYNHIFPKSSLVALVDFNNDVITDSLKVANHFKDKLKMIRVDTSPNMIDHYFDNKKKKEYGINSTLIIALRKSLDKAGFNHIKIIVSSNLNEDKIKALVKSKTPIDYFGVGHQLLVINNNFTCDAVKLNNKNLAKAGRSYFYNPNLKIIK